MNQIDENRKTWLDDIQNENDEGDWYEPERSLIK